VYPRLISPPIKHWSDDQLYIQCTLHVDIASPASPKAMRSSRADSRLGPHHRVLQLRHRYTSLRLIGQHCSKSVERQHTLRRRCGPSAVMAAPDQQEQRHDQSTAVRCSQHTPYTCFAKTKYCSCESAFEGVKCCGYRMQRSSVATGGRPWRAGRRAAGQDACHGGGVGPPSLVYSSPLSADACTFSDAPLGDIMKGLGTCCRRAWASQLKCWTPRRAAQQPALPGTRWAASAMLPPSGALRLLIRTCQVAERPRACCTSHACASCNPGSACSGSGAACEAAFMATVRRKSGHGATVQAKSKQFHGSSGLS
jgi:hypothetical protein